MRNFASRWLPMNMTLSSRKAQRLSHSMDGTALVHVAEHEEGSCGRCPSVGGDVCKGGSLQSPLPLEGVRGVDAPAVCLRAGTGRALHTDARLRVARDAGRSSAALMGG